MTSRTYGFYDPLAQVLDEIGERWALLVLRELLDGPRRYSELQGRLPGLSSARLADRLRQLRDCGLIEEGYSATARGRQFAPAIHALTRAGLAGLSPLKGTATVYRPSFAAYALRSLADAVPPSEETALFRTHVESEEFWTRHGTHGVATWVGDPAAAEPQIVVTDTITALSLATGTWTMQEARRHGRLSLERSPDGGRRWAQAHGLRR